MEEKQGKNFEVSSEKFSKVVGKLNKLYDNKKDSKFQEREDKYKSYIIKYVENLTKQDIKEVIYSLQILFNLNREFVEKTGDELIERIWKLYDLKAFEKGKIIIDKNNHLLNMINIFLLFNHYSLFENLYEIDEVNLKIKQRVPINQDVLNRLNFEFKSLSEQKNILIDLFIFFIFTTVELKSFYTSISTFMMSTDSNVILLFKTIALFGLSLAQINKKENFLASVYFLIGGVLRTHARSYLKTKGMLNENLSDVNCKKHKQGHHQHFEAKFLTTLECDFLEQYFFLIMIEFIQIITKSLNFNVKWDTLLFIFLKNLELEELDSEDHLPPEISIMHFTFLFLSDFVFSFITNFVKFDENNKILTKFDNFQEFIDLTISLISFSCYDILNIFLVSDRKKKILEIDCEKTEYEVKDLYNHYGICLIFYFILTGKFTFKSLKTNEVIMSSPLPCVINKDAISNVIKSIVYMFISSENNSHFSSLKNIRAFSYDLINLLIKNYINNDNNSVKENALIQNIIKEYLQIDCSEKDLIIISKLTSLFKDNSQSLFENLFYSCKDKKYLFKSFANLNLLLLIDPQFIMINYSILLNILKRFSLNGFILDDSVNQEIMKFYSKLKIEGNKDEFIKGIEHIILLLKNYENESNLNEEEKDIIKNNQIQLISVLTHYKN